MTDIGRPAGTGIENAAEPADLATTAGQLGRWDFLRYGAAAGVGAVALSQVQPPKRAEANRVVTANQRVAASPIPGVLDLYINEGYLKMVDDSLVYHRGFGDRPTDVDDYRPSLAIAPKVFTAGGQVVESRSYPLGAPLPPHGTPQPLGPDPANPGQHFIRRNYWASYYPQRTIIAEVGSRIRIRVHNLLSKPHQFTLHGAGPGRSDVSTGAIEPGGIAMLELDASTPGTYIYADPTNAPVERVLGLFGVLLIVDPDHQWAIGEDRASFERQWLWICHDVDPVWAGIEASGKTVDPRSTKAVPRYFLLNGRSGFESLGITANDALNLATREETLISGYPRQLDVRQFGEGTELGTLRGGQLLRMVNPGIVFHQMHFHGNHLWTVGRNNYNWPRSDGFVDPEGHVVVQQWEDVIELEPMDRKDCIIPIKRPPDAINAVWAARTTDWEYPMHCHAEPSQTAAGGLYPGGLVAHWTLKAPITGAAL